MLEEEIGHPVNFRNDVHGLDVYECHEAVRFASGSANAFQPYPPDRFAESIHASLAARRAHNDKVWVAAELYCAAFFDRASRSRFITLVTALEALLDNKPRTGEALALITSWQNELKKVPASALDHSTRSAMMSTLGFMQRESIGQAGRALSDRLLTDRIYRGESASEFFPQCYALRSEIVHSGRPKDASVDLSDLSNACMIFVGDLLREALRAGNG
jgi:hypothetical protein